MHEVINFLRGAVDRTSDSGVAGCYIVGKDSISARNGSLQAGIEYSSEVAFNVPAVELDAALGRMKQVQALGFSDGVLTIRGGRIKASIVCVDSEAPNVGTRPDEWCRVPSSFTESLKIAVKFTGNRGFSVGVRLMTGRITAISNVSGINIDCPDLEIGDRSVLLTPDCIKFLIDNGNPDYLAIDNSSIWFKWEDGRWVRAQLLVYDMPDTIDQVLRSVGDDAPIAITSDWREVLADAEALSDGTITFEPTGVTSSKGSSVSYIDLETGLPESHKSSWLAKALVPVMEHATAWNPMGYPKAVLFVGNSLRGIIVGVGK